MNIAIVDYGLGNLRSVYGAVAKLGHRAFITNDISKLEEADKLILPGVGAFGDGMNNLINLGLVESLTRLVLDEKKPILAICLGFQLLANKSLEFGQHKGLGWIDAVVRKIDTQKTHLRVPHVGWNDLFVYRDCVLWERIPKEALFYYVHSFYVDCKSDEIVVGECNYGIKFTSAVKQGNIYGTQFHPEKSQYHGLEVLKNFIEKA
jgi:imidazole glycerol-phosphate synthase subunit HisH